MTTKIRTLTILGLILVAESLSGCERPTHVKLEGGAAPVFELSGSGAVAIFTVYSPDYITKAEKPDDENFALWEIKPSAGHLRGTWIRDLGSITYGVVPAEYVQAIPKVGSPPPLTEGQRYFFTVDTTNAEGAAGFVEIRNSQAIQTHGGGPCFGLKDGKWFRAPCA